MRENVRLERIAKDPTKSYAIRVNALLSLLELWSLDYYQSGEIVKQLKMLTGNELKFTHIG